MLFRLICPFSFSSTLSFFRFFKVGTTGYVPVNIGYGSHPQMSVGIDSIEDWVYNSLHTATPAASVNSIQIGIIVLVVFL